MGRHFRTRVSPIRETLLRLSARARLLVDQVRIDSREGVRLGGDGNIVINNSYIETTGTGADHADGIQAYSPGSSGNLTITNTSIVSHNSAANAGLFIA